MISHLNPYSRILVCVCTALLCCSCRAPGNSANTLVVRPPVQKPLEDPAGQPAEYTIEPGDLLELKFFYQPELNDTLTVRPDGKISPQLIEEVTAEGMSVPELRQKLVQAYGKTLKQPVVNVAVKEIAEQRVFIGGEVTTPGLQQLRGRLTALQAIMQAGGIKNTAETRQVVILRNQGTTKPLFIKVNLDNDLSTGNATHDIVLRPMDIVWIPRTQIAVLDDLVDQYIDKLIVGQRSVGVFYDVASSAATVVK